jgi:hypothetical protein
MKPHTCTRVKHAYGSSWTVPTCCKQRCCLCQVRPRHLVVLLHINTEEAQMLKRSPAGSVSPMAFASALRTLLLLVLRYVQVARGGNESDGHAVPRSAVLRIAWTYVEAGRRYWQQQGMRTRQQLTSAPQLLRQTCVACRLLLHQQPPPAACPNLLGPELLTAKRHPRALAARRCCNCPAANAALTRDHPSWLQASAGT